MTRAKPKKAGRPKSPAERTREWKHRKARGVRVIPIEVSDDQVRGLIAARWLEPERKNGELHVTRKEIGRAIEELLKDLANG